jgi:hypothetical protein
MLICIFLLGGIFCFSREERQIALKRAFPDPTSIIERDFISTPYDLKIYDNIFIATDAKDSAIKIFSNNGEFIRAIGKRGQGPSDIIDPFVCTVDPNNGNIYCFDQGNSRISCFSLNGLIISSFRVTATVWDLMFFREHIFASAVNHSKRSLFLKYEKNGSIVSLFGDFFDNEVNSMPEQYKSVLYGNVILRSKDDYIYAVYERLPYIQIYDTEGKLIDTIRMDFNEANEVYKKNISAHKNRTGSRMGLAAIINGASVDDKKFYLYSPYNAESLIVLNEKGRIIDRIVFREKMDRMDLIRKKYIAKIGNLFYFLDLGSGQIQVYE